MDNKCNSKNHCVTIDLNLKIKFEFSLESLSCINIIWSMRKTGLRVGTEYSLHYILLHKIVDLNLNRKWIPEEFLTFYEAAKHSESVKLYAVDVTMELNCEDL